MRNYANDPILGNGLILDLQFNHTMADLLAGGGTTYMFDRGPNRISSTCVSFVAGTWAIETPSYTPVLTIDLDGSADEVTVGTDAAFDTIATTDAVTYEIMCIPDAVGIDCLMGGFVTGTPGEACYPYLVIDGSGYVEFRPTQDGTETSVVTGSVDVTGGASPVHIIATFSESDDIAKILVDGGSTDEATATLSCTNDTLQTLGAQNFYIGCKNNTAAATETFFDGHVFFARVWNRRLSHREQMLLYERARYAR